MNLTIYIKHTLEFTNVIKRNYLLLLFAIVPIKTLMAQPFAGGSGTQADPYQIGTPEQLDSVRNYLNSCFVLVNDIDLDVAPYNTGNGWVPIGTNSETFKGHFNGAGHLILNLYMNGSSQMGLFYSTNHLASISNLGIVNCNISGHQGGGLIYQSDALIYNCYITGKVSGESYSGGLVGFNYGSIINCYSTCNVNGNTYVGGIAATVSEAGAYITNCYASGLIGGNGSIGGIVGYVNWGNVKSCYFDSLATGLNKGAGLVHDNAYASITALSTVQIRKQSNLDSLDFSNTWIIKEDSTYPGLQGTDNAPFAFRDTICVAVKTPLSLLLKNDFDIETIQSSLIVRVEKLYGIGYTDTVSYFMFPKDSSPGTIDSLLYRVGEERSDGKILWGNSVVAIMQKVTNSSPIITSTAPPSVDSGDTYTYTVVVADTENDVLTYMISNAPEGMSIDGNVISWAPAEGTNTSGEVTLTVSDGELSDYEVFTISVTTPVNSVENHSMVWKVFPNPASDALFIECEDIQKAGIGIQIIGTDGKIYRNKQLNSLNTNKLTINLYGIPTGIYCCRLLMDNQVENIKFIKK